MQGRLTGNPSRDHRAQIHGLQNQKQCFGFHCQNTVSDSGGPGGHDDSETQTPPQTISPEASDLSAEALDSFNGFGASGNPTNHGLGYCTTLSYIAAYCSTSSQIILDFGLSEHMYAIVYLGRGLGSAGLGCRVRAHNTRHHAECSCW